MVISELRFHPDSAENWHAGTFLGIVTCVDKDQVDLPLCAKRSCWYRRQDDDGWSLILLYWSYKMMGR